MNHLDELLTKLNWRYATKQFDSTKKVPEETFNKLIEAARLSPSSFGLQPWTFVVVRDPKVRSELKAHAWNQPQIVEASHLVVLCSQNEMTADHINRFADNLALERGLKPADIQPYREMMLGSLPGMQGEPGKAWMTHQVYIALGMLLSACAVANIDSCPMEGFDRTAFDKILKLNSLGIESRAVCAIGYRSADDGYAKLKKVRKSVTEAIRTI